MNHQVENRSYKQNISQKRLCVVGPGAIGITIAARLALSGNNVAVCARGESLAVIKQQGLKFLNREGEHKVAVRVGEPLDLGPQDVVFLCSKAQDLPALAEWAQPVISKGTLIVPMVNGIPWWYFDGEQGKFAGKVVEAVDPRGNLRTFLPSQQVVGSVALITADRPSPGFARSFNPLILTLGEIDNTASDRTNDLAATMTAAGVSARVSQRIRDPLWTKAIANLISNPLSVLTGGTIEEICSDPAVCVTTRRLLNEALLTAAASGARVELDPASLLQMGASMGPMKTSMLQDFEKGVPLELSSICEAVLELADLHDVPMPLTRTIASLASFRSQASRGMKPMGTNVAGQNENCLPASASG